MDKSLLIFIVIGVGALYLLMHFLGEMEEEDDRYKSTQKVEQKRSQYIRTDSVGQMILVFDSNVDIRTQMSIWNSSKVKKEFLSIFPDYGDMQIFIKERIKGDALQRKLLKRLNEVEGKFFSGTLSTEEAKQMLDSIE